MIDRKGRLFGKINIIDLLFLLVLIVAVVGGFSRMRHSPVAIEKTSKGKVTLLVEEVRMPSVENIMEGSELYSFEKGSYFGKVSAKKVVPFEDATEYKGQWINAPVPDKYSVYVDVDVDIAENDRAYLISGDEVRVGGEYRLKSKTCTFNGICVGIAVTGE